MSDRVEWRRVYGKPTAFLGGIEVGDCYQSAGAQEGDVWRVRVWNPDRPDNRRLRYVKTPDAARDDHEEQERFVMEALLQMLERGRREGAD